MGILVPNLIACENDPDTYKRQIKESLNSFKQFESELFHRAEFGIERRIERADSLLKRLEDLKIKINEIGSSSTLYFPSKLISPSESEFKVLSDDFLKIYQQNNITENILDMEYEKLRLLKDEAHLKAWHDKLQECQNTAAIPALPLITSPTSGPKYVC